MTVCGAHATSIFSHCQFKREYWVYAPHRMSHSPQLPINRRQAHWRKILRNQLRHLSRLCLFFFPRTSCEFNDLDFCFCSWCSVGMAHYQFRLGLTLDARCRWPPWVVQFFSCFVEIFAHSIYDQIIIRDWRDEMARLSTSRVRNAYPISHGRVKYLAFFVIKTVFIDDLQLFADNVVVLSSLAIYSFRCRSAFMHH